MSCEDGIVKWLWRAVVLSLVLAGCASDATLNDPDAIAVHFDNDLSQPVVLALCQSDHSAVCEHPFYSDHIPAGASDVENISPGVRTEWAVEDDSGALLRCVILYWEHWSGGDEPHVSLSSAPTWGDPCPRQTN